ncbi:hypothetical protein [Streptomyces cyaneofuscatus]|uniref:hypothetical protein n=2 Tax=Streptomyces cyaneofuscatus TaxID=66883 RepID=UPI0036B0649C
MTPSAAPDLTTRAAGGGGPFGRPDGGREMIDFLAGLPAFTAFAVVWGSAFGLFMTCSLLRLGYELQRDRVVMRRFLGAGADAPVLAAYHLKGEAAATRTGMLVLARRHGHSRERERRARSRPEPLLAALRTPVREAAEAGEAHSVRRVRASDGYPAFRSELREAAEHRLPRRRTRCVLDRVAAWAAVFGLAAVLVYGIGFYVQRPDASGFWFLIALAAHAPAGIWIGMTDGQGGRFAAPQWPEFDALCRRLVEKEEARAPLQFRIERVETEHPAKPPASGWAGDGGVGASSSCGGGSGGGCGGGV